jgi:hypothetical protein
MVDGRLREAVVSLVERCGLRSTSEKDNVDPLFAQHLLAGAFQADAQLQKAIGLPEHAVDVQSGSFRDCVRRAKHNGTPQPFRSRPSLILLMVIALSKLSFWVPPRSKKD